MPTKSPKRKDANDENEYGRSPYSPDYHGSPYSQPSNPGTSGSDSDYQQSPYSSDYEGSPYVSSYSSGDPAGTEGPGYERSPYSPDYARSSYGPARENPGVYDNEPDFNQIMEQMENSEGDDQEANSEDGYQKSPYSPDYESRPYSSTGGQSSPDGPGYERSPYSPDYDRGRSSDPLDRRDLSDQEQEAGSGSTPNISDDEKSFMNRSDAAEQNRNAGKGLYSGDEGPGGSLASNLKGKAIKLIKKRIAFTAIGGILIAGAIFAFVILQGPFQLVHLSQILQKANYAMEAASIFRTHSWYRYHRDNDLGQTRVSYVGSKIAGKALRDLEKKGIKFERDANGYLRKMSIDTTKHPEFQNLDEDQAKRQFAKKFGVPLNQVESSGPGGRSLSLDMNGRSIKKSREIVNTARKDLDQNYLTRKTLGGLMMRNLGKQFGIPSLYSPLERGAQATARKISNRAERREAEKERTQSKLKAQLHPRYANARDKLKSKMDPHRASLSAGLVATSAVCLVRDVSGVIPLVNRAEIVIPSVLQAADKMAVGAQIQSGQVSMLAVSGVAASLYDEDGKSVFGATALKELSGKSQVSAADLEDPNDISDGYKQAFSNDTTAAKIQGYADIPMAGAACSPVGQAVQTVAGIGLLLLGPGGWAAKAASAGGGAAASAAVLLLLQEQLIEILQGDAIVPAIYAGLDGGNLLAYGAREAANTSARAAGAIQLTGAETAALRKQQLEEDRSEWESKNLASRIFDPYDHRSLIAKGIDHANTDPAQNVSYVASRLLNVGSLFSGFTSMLSPKVEARDGPYDWAFPQFGMPESVMDHKNHRNPYENSERAAGILEADQATGGRIADRAKKCFGAEISKGSQGWQSIVAEEVNPQGEEYLESNCSDRSDAAWMTIAVFVFDNQIMLSAACYDGDDEACSDIGAGGAPSSAGNSSETAGSKIDIDKLKEPSDNIACSESTKDAGVIDGYTGGNKVRIRLCEVPNLPQLSGYGAKNGHATVNSRVSGAVYEMVEAAKQDGVEMIAASSSRTMADQQSLCPCDGVTVAHPGYSNHQLGVAIDFGGNGQLMDRNNPMWKWLDSNASRFDYKPYEIEPWHWSPFGA